MAEVNSLLIKNGTIVNSDRSFKADVLCSGGKIVKIGEILDAPKEARVIDASGLLVMPGGIDPHTHIAMPFMGTVTVDEWESGTRCAIAGGTTTIVDFIIPTKGKSFMSAFEAWKNSASKAMCNYGFHCAVSYWNKQVQEEYPALVEAGVVSFKHFLAYKGALMLNDDELIESFSRCQELGILAAVHCENGDLVWWKQRNLLSQGITTPIGHPLSRPPITESEAVSRACTIANQIGVPLVVVHNTCKGAIDAIHRCRKQGSNIFAEVTSIHLTLDESNYSNPDWAHAAHHVLSPPLRSKSHTEYLWNSLNAGTIQYIATDHCSFCTEQKLMGKDDFTKIPNGCPGLEERLMLIWENGVVSGRMSPEKFVELTSTFAAKLYNLYPQKGVVMEGSDADLVLWDPKKSRTISAKTHQSRNDFNVYEGITSSGSPAITILNGVVAYEDGKVLAKCGDGKYIPRKPYGYAYAAKKKCC